jgi:polyisoprenoid-binding protein YceI
MITVSLAAVARRDSRIVQQPAREAYKTRRAVDDNLNVHRLLTGLATRGVREDSIMRMTAFLRLHARLIGYCLALVPAAAGAQTATELAGGVLRSGTLSFSAHATVGDFTGTTTTVAGMWSGDLPAASGWVEAPAATLVTRNGHRDRDLRASMEVDKYPTMRFDLARAALASPGARPDDAVSVTLYGTLAIHGVTRAVELPATTVRAGDTIYVRSNFPLDLGDYHIGGLTKMLGMLRMDPKIVVHVDLRFLAKSSVKASTDRP